MPQVKQDKRVVKWLGAVLVIGPLGTLGLYLAFGNGGAATGVFGAIVLVAVGIARIQNHYRCPDCGRRTEIEPALLDTHDSIRHRCVACDTVWDLEIKIGSSGEV